MGASLRSKLAPRKGPAKDKGFRTLVARFREEWGVGTGQELALVLDGRLHRGRAFLLLQVSNDAGQAEGMAGG